MRLPLHIKLMGSYLLVVGLVLLPTAVYLRTTLARDQRARARAELQGELEGICARLGDTSGAELEERTQLLVTALSTRLTVVDPTGRVVGDSFRSPGRLDNHATRPEVREAFQRGVGVSMRRSQTTGQVMLYVAMRFPRQGAARGVARLAVSEASVDAASQQVAMVVRNTAAGALSVAVLLSLLAALLASRPLRRIAAGARAFAAGDFGFELDVGGRDEIGEVAEALEALASQLRARLLTAGVDRATLEALLDDLPVGVVLYDAERRPLEVNGAARALCDLPPYVERERAAEIARLEGQGQAIHRTLRDGLTVEVPLSLPWRPEASLVARWVAVFAPDGTRLPALVVVDRGDARALSLAHERVARLASLVAAAASDAPDDARGAEMESVALAAEASLPRAAPTTDAVRPVSLRALHEIAHGRVARLAAQQGVTVALDAADPALRVVDADGRVALALATVYGWALARQHAGGELTVTATASERAVRFEVHAPRSASEHAPDVAPLVRPLGGDAGVSPGDAGVECWVDAPRA